MGDQQQLLLEAIARAVGVTSTVNVVALVTVGRLYVLYRATRPRETPAQRRAWQMERNLLRPFVVRFWRRPLVTITREDWDAHIQLRRQQKTRLRRPPCQLTLNLELSRTKSLLAWAVKTERLARHPLDECRRVKTRDRRESWFTAEQIDRLIKFASALRWRHQQIAFAALAAVMGDTGLRISEALSLRWDRITLRGTTSVLGKGSKTRVIGFTHRDLELLAALPRHPSNPHVFVNWTTRKTFDPSTVRAWFRGAVSAAGLEGVKIEGDLALVPHNLRHSAASIADERGAPATWIQAMLGHAHLSTTMKYLHRSEADAALRMAAIMGDRKAPRRAVHKLRGNPEKVFVKRERTRVTSFS